MRHTRASRARVLAILPRHLPSAGVAAARVVFSADRVAPSFACVTGMCVVFSRMATRLRHLGLLLRWCTRRATGRRRRRRNRRLRLSNRGARRRHSGIVVSPARYAVWLFARLRFTLHNVYVTHLLVALLWQRFLCRGRYRRQIRSVGVLKKTLDNGATAKTMTEHVILTSRHLPITFNISRKGMSLVSCHLSLSTA